MCGQYAKYLTRLLSRILPLASGQRAIYYTVTWSNIFAYCPSNHIIFAICSSNKKYLRVNCNSNCDHQTHSSNHKRYGNLMTLWNRKLLNGYEKVLPNPLDAIRYEYNCKQEFRKHLYRRHTTSTKPRVTVFRPWAWDDDLLCRTFWPLPINFTTQAVIFNRACSISRVTYLFPCGPNRQMKLKILSVQNADDNKNTLPLNVSKV